MKSNQPAQKSPLDLPAFSDSDIRIYEDPLLETYHAPYLHRPIDKGWTTVKNGCITQAKLRGHFGGRYFIGATGRPYAKTVTVDIDCHHGESDHLIKDLAARTISTFEDAQAIPVQSSESGGVHVLYLLQKSSWSASSRAFVEDELRKSGIPIKKNGKKGVEILGSRRLPFGRGSFLLDPYDLEPISDNIGSLREFIWKVRLDKYERLHIPPGYRPQLTPTTDPPERLTRLRNDLGPSEFMVRVDGYLTVGLTEFGTRNTATLELCWYYIVIEKRTKAETKKLLDRWIREKNNGVSKDFLRDPEAVYRHNARIVTAFDITKVTGNGTTTRKISREDQRTIQQYLAQLDLKRPLRRLYEHILIHCLRWCDCSTSETTAEIPRVYLRKCVYRYRPVLDKLKDKGLVREISDYSRAKNQCRRYAVRIPTFKRDI